MTKTRREFIVQGSQAALKLGLAAPLAQLAFSSWASAGTAGPIVAEPHFFVQILTPPSSGADCSYLFDARPLAMTAAGLIQNYLGADPAVWTGVNGQTTLATRLTDPLLPYRDRFSILNGVHMASTFDGHDQNMNFLLAGNPFGGESFIPHLNRLARGRPAALDGLQRGSVNATLGNTANTVPLNATSAKNLIDRLGTLAPLEPSSALVRFLDARLAASSQDMSRFGLGAKALRSALGGAPSLSAQLRGIQLDPNVADDYPGFISLMGQAFRLGVARSAVIVVGTEDNLLFDTHDAESARRQPATFRDYVAKLAQIFKLLKDTPFDESRSLLDVTTVMVASEFSRTMRQEGAAIDATGTDHNPLNNSILIGGKGIRPGMVIGESDYRAAGETLSGAHLSFGSAELKAMGRPFDFTTLRPRGDLPASYDPAHYLSFHSIVNTVYKQFGVPAARYRSAARNAPPAPTLDALLS